MYESSMRHALTYILVFAALIVQIGLGGRPAGETCLCVPVVATTADRCTCCPEAERVAAPRGPSCPCDGGTCVCVAKTDTRAALNARSHSVRIGDDGTPIAMPFRPPGPTSPIARRARWAPPRATESPPHLAALRTVHLNI